MLEEYKSFMNWIRLLVVGSLVIVWLKFVLFTFRCNKCSASSGDHLPQSVNVHKFIFNRLWDQISWRYWTLLSAKCWEDKFQSNELPHYLGYNYFGVQMVITPVRRNFSKLLPQVDCIIPSAETFLSFKQNFISSAIVNSNRLNIYT